MTDITPSNTSLAYTSPSSPPYLVYAPLTPPAHDEVLVKIRAAAINPVDVQLWNDKLIGWFAGKKERGLGWDFSGEIVAVGEGRRREWSVGDEVFGLRMRLMGDGTFAQYVKIAKEDPMARKPSCWSFEEAASVPLVVLTAFACLDWLPRKSGDGERRVVVAGASGGTGMWCVQLAKQLFDCHVTGICSGRNADFVRSLGADSVVDYTSGHVADALLQRCRESRKYDLYIDCVGGVEIFTHWRDLIHPNGAYVTIVGDKVSRTVMGGPQTYLSYPSQVLRFLYGLVFGPRYANIMLQKKPAWLEKAAQMAQEGMTQVAIQEVVTGILTEGSGAWEKVKGLMEEGRVRGKVVLKIWD